MSQRGFIKGDERMNQENQLMEISEIKVTKGIIKFTGFEELKSQALEVAEFVSSIEVSEENVKEAKKLLAKVNKSINALEDRRIAIKKEILEPYNEFESKVKEIVGIVKEADTKVRDKVRELEEIEREEKRKEIEEIWNLRKQQYDFDFVDFERFLTPQHLNKTTSIKKVEEEMVEFLEKVNKDLETIKVLSNSREVLIEYKDTLDFTEAVMKANDRKLAEEQMNVLLGEDDEKFYIIRIENEKDFKLAKALLEANKVEFTVIKE